MDVMQLSFNYSPTEGPLDCFHSLANRVFCRAKIFNFDDTQIINFSLRYGTCVVKSLSLALDPKYVSLKYFCIFVRNQ